MGQAAELSGFSGARNVRQKINDIADGIVTSDAKVLDARFLLGGDDGAYLRSNIMPLQTIDDDYYLGNSRLLPQLEIAGRAGVLNALEQRLKEEKATFLDDMTKILALCAYLLTIPEINDFVSKQLEAEGADEVVTLVESLRPPEGTDGAPMDSAKGAFVNYGGDETALAARCHVLRAVLLLFNKPMEVARDQWERTVGSSGTGTTQVRDALEKLALSARKIKATYDANRVGVAPDNGGEVFAADRALPGASTAPFLGWIPRRGDSSDEGDVLQAAREATAARAERVQRIREQLIKALRSSSRRAGGPSNEAQAEPAAYPAFPKAAPFPAAAPSCDEPAPAPEATPPPVLAARDPAETADFCRLTGIDFNNEQQTTRAVDALCAGITQLREDGGFSFYKKGVIRRESGVSANWNFRRSRSLYSRSREGNDSWDRKLWPRGDGETYAPPGQLQESLASSFGLLNATSLTTRVSVQDGSELALIYCLNRGLCGQRAPHHARPVTGNILRYNLPLTDFPKTIVDKYKDAAPKTTEHTRLRAASDRAFGDVEVEAMPDFVRGYYDVPHPVLDQPRLVRWAPVTRESNTWMMSESDQVKSLATAVVWEHMNDYFKAKHVLTTGYQSKMFCAAAAAVKILQLQSLAAMYEGGSLDSLAAPYNRVVDDAHAFITRPCLRCPDKSDGSSVLYPCDAGMWTVVFKGGDVDDLTQIESAPALDSNFAYGQVEKTAAAAAAAGSRRRVIKRDIATSHLRGLLTVGGNVPPLYVAHAPGVGSPLVIDEYFLQDAPLRAAISGWKFPKGSKDLLTPDAIKNTLVSGLRICENLERFKCEEDYIARMRKEDAEETARVGKATDVEELSRARREAVWSDAEREASIAGDRLYAFVRQLSGTISEQVDAVCMIDEGMLVRQQQQARERRLRMADQAAREHMQLVRGVFTTVLRESGLALGFGQGGDPGELKVVSTSLRKQANEISQQGGSSDGFFSNAVRLERLLQSGTGEMTLSDLFGRLREAGMAMQDAVMASQPVDGASGSSASIDFLSAPRNSLVLRYKPEALAAMRQGFDVFQREMMAQHGRMYRTISAYELIEGSDESLCSAFAAFAAHMLVHARMYASSTAMYVAAWPAAANAQQLKISLQRLVRVACQYLAYAASPNFLSDTGRAAYFAQATAVGVPVAPPRYFEPHGQWGLNLYR